MDTVFYTHLHLDHVGWTTTAGRFTFPRARHLVGEGELEFWQRCDDEVLAAVGPDPESVLQPLCGRADPVADGFVLAPGVSVLATPGHTPGHCSVVLSSGTERAIVLGDVLHCPVQLVRNDVAMVFDADPAQAALTRDRVATQIEDDPGVVAAHSHFTGSAFGRVVRDSERRTWSSRTTATADPVDS